MGNPDITNELQRMDEKKQNNLQQATDLWCEGINDLGCKWFCELENEQNPDLRPWDRGRWFLKSRLGREEWSVFTRRNFFITSCCGHNNKDDC